MDLMEKQNVSLCENTSIIALKQNAFMYQFYLKVNSTLIEKKNHIKNSVPKCIESRAATKTYKSQVMKCPICCLIYYF